VLSWSRPTRLRYAELVFVSANTQLDRFTVPRRNMVERQVRARGVRDSRVLHAMEQVPRHEFVAPTYQDQAYDDHPIPIGEGQTVSQPYIVGLTLEALSLQASDRVLEIGTGSGYQAALLGALAKQVYSMERYEELAKQAEAALARLGYTNVAIVVADGSVGLATEAPFDAIVVAAAAPDVPTPLLDQLRDGGRMVIPVGPPHAQDLQLVRKSEGRLIVASLGACAFVPLIGEQGYRSAW